MLSRRLPQLLALTTTDGDFYLGTLSKTTCWLRNIAVTDRSKAPSPPPPRPSAAAAAGTRIPERSAAYPYSAGGADGHYDGGQELPVRGWGWRLLGTGREAVAAAANAAVDALSSPRAPADSGSPFFASGGGGRGSSRGRQPGAAAAVAAAGIADAGEAGGTGAVGVEFSAKGCLMAVALADGTVLLTRVDRYTSGVRCVPAIGPQSLWPYACGAAVGEGTIWATWFPRLR